MTEGEEVLEFPCDFPVKVMGRGDGEFREIAHQIVSRHFSVTTADVTEQLSRNGRFVSLTFTVKAQNRAGLDALYEELSANKSVLVAL